MAIAAIMLAAVICCARLVQWQVFDRARLLAAAEKQTSGTVVQAPVRGTITDSSGTVILATTVIRYRLVAQPDAIPSVDRASVAAQLAALTDGGASEATRMTDLLNAGRPRAVLATALDDQVAVRVRSAIADGALPGISLEEQRVRSYPQPGGGAGTSLASDLLGFVNSDGVGQYGLEGYYNDELSGAPRVTSVQRGDGGALQSVELAAGRPSVDLQLCVDARLQTMVEQEVTVAGIADRAESASVIVMDPYTGAVLSSASWPSYDANDYGATAARDPSRFMDPAVSNVYEPGSVMKVLTSVAALEAGTATPSTIIQDEKVLVLDNGATKVRNANLQSKGALTLTEALAFSRNIVFSKVALGLGSTTSAAAERLYQTWMRFGIGGRTGVDLAGENQGLTNDPTQGRWRQIDLANASFGQGVATTLMQLAVAYSAIVNGGVLVRPRVVSAVNGVPVPITSRGTATTPEVSKELIQMTAAAPKIVPLYARLAALPSYVYGGKTGTAEIWLKDANGGKGAFDTAHYNFTFIGWFGRTAPEYVIAVVLRHATPVITGPGHMTNAIESYELFRRVAQDMIALYGITPAAVGDSRLTSPTHPGAPEPSAPVVPAVGGVLPTPERFGRRG